MNQELGSEDQHVPMVLEHELMDEVQCRNHTFGLASEEELALALELPSASPGEELTSGEPQVLTDAVIPFP